MPLREDLRNLLALRSSPVRWPIALTVAIAMAAPIAILTALGHAGWGAVASSGSLLSLYLSDRSRRERLWALPLIGLGLVATALVAGLVAGDPAVVIPVMGAVTIAAAVVLALRQVGPPGPIFFVLVAGSSARVATPASAGGPGMPPLLVAGLVAAGCLVAWLVVAAPLAVPVLNSRDREQHRREDRRGFGITEPGRAILPRVVIAVVLDLVLAVLLGEHRPYWIVLSSIAILQKEPHLRLTALRGVHRAVGTLLGTGVFALLAWANPHGYLLAVTLGVLQYIVEVLVTRNYGLALVFVTPLALILAEQGPGVSPAAVTWERVADTVMGAGVAGLVLLVTLGARRWRRWRRSPAPAAP